MLLMARALPPAAGHHKVSGWNGHAESGGAHRASQAGLGHQLRPTSTTGGHRGLPHPEPGQPGPHPHICKSTVTHPGQE